MTIKFYNSLPGSTLRSGSLLSQKSQDGLLNEDNQGSSAEASASLEEDARKKSMYTAAYPQHPKSAYNTPKLDTAAATIPAHRSPAPWDGPTTRNSRPSHTTYDTEILHGAETRARQLAEVEEIPVTTVDYTSTHRHGARLQDTRMRTSAGLQGPLGYRTEYAVSMGARQVPELCAATNLAATKSFGNTQTLGDTLGEVDEPLIRGRTSRGAPVPLGNSALQQNQTSYSLDYGRAGADPLDRTARSATEMTHTACTQDLAEGTVRSTTQRIPGYTGHVSAGSIASDEIVNEARQPGTLLLALSQYPRERVPGCTKHFPRAARNIRDPPSAAPHMDPDWAQCTAAGSPNAINSRKGVISFFNSGSSPFESDNGLTEAQRFFQTNQKRGRIFRF